MFLRFIFFCVFFTMSIYAQKYNLHKATELQQYNKDFVLNAVKEDGYNLRWAKEIFKRDPEVVLTALQSKNRPRVIQHAHTSLKNNKSFLFEAIKVMPYILYDLEDYLKQDKEIVLAAVKQDGSIVRQIDESLKNDRDIILAAIEDYPYYFVKKHMFVKDNKEVVLKAVQYQGIYLEYASDTLKRDKEVVYEAVKQNGFAFKFVDEVLKKDRDFILKLSEVSKNFYHLLSKEFKKDREILVNTLKLDGCALLRADKSLRSDRELTLMAVKTCPNVISYMGFNTEYWKDKEIILEAVKRQGELLAYAKNGFNADKEVVREALKNDPMALQYASKKLRADKKIVKLAVEKIGTAMQFADDQLRKDKEVALAAIRSRSEAIQIVHSSVLEDKNIAFKILEEDVSLFKYLPKKLRADKEIALKATKSDPSLVCYADESLQNGYSCPKYIKRSFKADAWTHYRIDDAIASLFGNDVKYVQDDKIKISISNIGTEINDISVSVSGKKDIQSVAILQDNQKDCNLVAFFDVVGFKLNTKVKYTGENRANASMKIIVVVQTKLGKYYRSEQKVVKPICIYDNSEAEERYENIKQKLKENKSKKYIFEKIKFKTYQGKSYSSLMFTVLHPMLGYDQKNKDVDFITRIVGKVKDRTVFDIYTSEFFPQELTMKMMLENLKKSDQLDISLTDINGKNYVEKFELNRKLKVHNDSN